MTFEIYLLDKHSTSVFAILTGTGSKQKSNGKNREKVL